MLVRKHWRRLFPVVLGAFLLHVTLTALLVNLAARRTVNLDSMLLFYEIDDNSTAPAGDAVVMAVGTVDEGTNTSISPLWKLHLTGEFFWRSSYIITMVFLSRACRLEDHGGAAQGIPRASAWRVWMSWAFLVVFSFIVEAIENTVFLTLFKALEEEGETNLLGLLFESAGSSVWVYPLAAVVYSGGVNGFSAINKAWQLEAQNLKVMYLVSITCWLLLEALESVWLMIIPPYESKQEKAEAVIWEDTATDILMFSLFASLMAVTMQTFHCSVLLAFYRQIDEQPHQQINGQPHQS